MAVSASEKQKKKLLVLFCGGTISMHKNSETGALVIDHSIDQLLALEPRIEEIASLESEFIANIDSSNATKKLWIDIVDAITRNYDRFDGFVVTMGTNTMAYCSSAISFALGDIGKPVCITGAQIPAEAFNTDGRNNLVNSVRVAAMEIAGVYVVFGSRIIEGVRAKKISESELDAFKSFNKKDIGEIGIGTIFNSSPRKRHAEALKPINVFIDRIACLTLIPGISSDAITTLMDAGFKGFVLRAYGSGDLSEDLFPALAEAQKREIPIVVTTQCPGGATVMGINDVGRLALEYGVIEAFDMSMEAMSTKLMWLLGQNTPYGSFKQRMQENLRGECNSERAYFIKNQ